MLARRAASPSGGASSSSSSSKRKRTGDGAGSDSEGGGSSSAPAGDGSKRRKGASSGKSPSPGPSSSGALLSAADLIAYLRARPAHTSTTKDLLRHFGRALKDKRNKEAMGGLLKAVADFKEGSLVLKAGL